MPHALVFGGSGISGWAVVNQALQYPTRTSFDRVTALTNRPLSHEESKFPNDARLQLVSGIDLTGALESVVHGLESKVNGANTVTHVFFNAYVASTYGEWEKNRTINTALTMTAIRAIQQVSPSLQAVILQTGGKAYGVEFAHELTLTPPFVESQPRIPEPWYSKIAYYAQADALMAESKGKAWTFSEVRPDVIVGFTVGINFANAAQGLGFYLTLWRKVFGDKPVPFPGTLKSWTNKQTDTWQDVLARQEIWLALNQDKVANGAAFNVTDGEVTTWEQKWPLVCKYFGLKGVEPEADPTDYAAFAEAHLNVWKCLEEEHHLKKGIFEKYPWWFMYGVTIVYDYDRQYDTTAIRKAGFSETAKSIDGWTASFDRMRAAKIMP